MKPAEKARIAAHALTVLRAGQAMLLAAGLDPVKHSREIARDEYRQARDNFRSEKVSHMRPFHRYQALHAIATLKALELMQ